MHPSRGSRSRLRLCAVSYLNTAPLVWGMLHGRQQGIFDLVFRIPSACADMLASGEADLGIVPSFELTRQRLASVPGVGIACRGAVRSILLISKVPLWAIERLAADASSRTSVALARILLARRFGVAPEVTSLEPDLPSMLAGADAALVIGDPALRLEPAALPYEVYDLGEEWTALTGLPMVFAVWAGRPECVQTGVIEALQDSCRFGLEHLEEIVQAESGARGFAPDLVRRYLTENLVCQLGPAEYEGLDVFLRYAREIQAQRREDLRWGVSKP